jgi:4-amino-4-deoxy-L-arabinose transferase-like glycosyltransferase
MYFKLLLIAGLLFTRFWGINWAGGFHFHPDENNMAWAVDRLSWDNFDPDFFAYGQFPLYLSFLSKQLIPADSHLHLRFWSAVFSLLTVIIGYLLAKEVFKSQKWASITGLLLIFTPGLIQMAHFGTTESLLTFVGISSAYLAVKYYDTQKIKYLILSSLVSAIGIAGKLNAVLFLLGPFLAVIIKPRRFRRLIPWGASTILLTALFSPYYLLEFRNFWGTFKYESNLARGLTQVFYMRQFINTQPFLFQFKKILPWVLGLPMFTFLFIGLFFVILKSLPSLKNPLKGIKSTPATSYLLLATFTPWFIFNSLLFAKWTRFTTPILPFLILFIVFFLKKSKLLVTNYLLLITLFMLILPGILFMKIYFQPDIRVRACQWMNKNLPEGSVIVYEGGNIIDLPRFDHDKFETINIDFYHLDERGDQQEKLSAALDQADYFFSPSRRMFTNHLRLSDRYPVTANFYHDLFSGELGFNQVRTFRPFGTVGQFLLGSDLNAEETWTVFDHPTLRLWKKQK